MQFQMIMNMNFAAGVLVGVVSALLAAPCATGQGNDERILIDVAVVSSINEISVPSRLKGFIVQLAVEEGDEVEAGQLLAELDKASIQHELKAAEVRHANAQLQADDRTPIEYAQATLDVAKQELKINEGLRLRDALPQQELERSRLAKVQADLQVNRSVAQRTIDQGNAELELQNIAAVRELLGRHTIVAEFAGQIIDVNRRGGEFIQEGETLLRLVDLSKVRVEGSVDVLRVSPDRLVGRPVVVRQQLANNEAATFDGTVTSLGLNSMEPGTYLVQATVENEKRGDQWLLRPNSRVEIEVLPGN